MVKKKREKSWYYLSFLLTLSRLLLVCDSTAAAAEGRASTTGTTLPSEPFGFNGSSLSYEIGKQNCSWDLNDPWPPDPPGETLVLALLMTQTGTPSERLGLKIPGMMTYAIETVNSQWILPKNYTLQVEFHDTNGIEATSTRLVTDLICRNIAGIIGPEHSCWIEASIAEAKNIPMISYACTDSRASERKTFARTNPSEIHILRETVMTMKNFKWNNFSIIYHHDPAHIAMMKTLRREAKLANMGINHEESFSNENDFPGIFRNTKAKTRIYVLLAHYLTVPKALLAMTISGLLKAHKKEYFLIYIDIEEFLHSTWHKYVFDTAISQQTHGKKCLPKDLQSYEDSFMVIANTLTTTDKLELASKTRAYNKKPPFCLSTFGLEHLFRNVLRMNTDTPKAKHVPLLPASHLYDAVLLYARVVRKIYEERIETNSSKSTDVSDIGRDGLAIAEKITNYTFRSILGFNVAMGLNRASKGNYSVYYFKKAAECNQTFHRSNDTDCSSHCLVELVNIKNVTIDVLAVPKCGYDGQACGATTDVKNILFITLGSSVLFLILFSFLQYHHWKYEQEISGLSWRISEGQLKHNMKNLSSSRTSITSVDCTYQLYVAERMAEYKGTTCYLKFIDLESKKQDLNRKIMKNMKSMREIKHRNVCQFIGAYIHERRLTLVTEYANRGSLEDILQSNFKLDDLFISSLVQDLLRAMVFLHSSFGPHGNLKSNNCVVTGRWVLQVTDYDLHDLRYESVKSLMREEDYLNSPEWQKHVKSALWRAPELLLLDPTPGTKEGDVYSFGIILHEIIARQGPFSTYDADSVDYQALIMEIKAGKTILGSLKRPDLLDLVMNEPFGTDQDVIAAMEASWAQDPKFRPDFKELSTKLKKMKKPFGNLVDHMVSVLEDHNRNLEERVAKKTCELQEEKKRSENLLYSMLPKEVARSICKDVPVPPRCFDSVTIYFSDIVGFTSLASVSSPYEIFQFLDDLYNEFDNTIRGFDVYKVETIGDAYMVVSGLSDTKNKVSHAGAVASMALELLQKVESFKIRNKPDYKLKLRIGLHTGPVIAGVVGKTMPRYCLFGDTVNMASRMESNGAPLRIHISENCKQALDALGGYNVEKRDKITVKGKGEVQTYWLNSAREGAIKRKEIVVVEKNPYDGTELRRRSPRVSVEMRTPRSMTPRITSKSYCREEDFYKPLPTSRSDDSPPRGLAHYHFKKLSNSMKASSMDSPNHLLSLPPNDTKSKGSGSCCSSSPGSLKESCSLDEIHSSSINATQVSLSLSPFVNSSSTYAAPPPEDVSPRVNFSPTARFNDHQIDERDPMLDRDSDESSAAAAARVERKSDSSGVGGSSTKRWWTFVHSVFPKVARDPLLNSHKSSSSINGLQRESHV